MQARGGPCPLPQHLLVTKRYGCERAAETPVIPLSFTSQKVPWHAPQKSTESVGESLAELKIRLGPDSGMPEIFASRMAVTCFAPGPWHASQLTPGVRFFSSSLPSKIPAVVWQPKHLTTSAGPTFRYMASSALFGEAKARPGVKFRVFRESKNETRAS